MKTRTILSALVVSTLGFATLAQAQNDWQQRERREQREMREQERERRAEQRRWRVEQQRQLERQQRALEQRQLGGPRFMPHSSSERPHPTIDTRTQRLPAAPYGHEWQTAPNGDFMLVNQLNGMTVQLIRNVTPQNGSPQ